MGAPERFLDSASGFAQHDNAHTTPPVHPHPPRKRADLSQGARWGRQGAHKGRPYTRRGSCLRRNDRGCAPRPVHPHPSRCRATTRSASSGQALSQRARWGPPRDSSTPLRSARNDNPAPTLGCEVPAFAGTTGAAPRVWFALTPAPKRVPLSQGARGEAGRPRGTPLHRARFLPSQERRVCASALRRVVRCPRTLDSRRCGNDGQLPRFAASRATRSWRMREKR